MIPDSKSAGLRCREVSWRGRLRSGSLIRIEDPDGREDDVWQRMRLSCIAYRSHGRAQTRCVDANTEIGNEALPVDVVARTRPQPPPRATRRGHDAWRITGRAACVSEPVLRQVGQAEGQSHAMCNRLPSRLGLAATSSLSSMGLAATGRGHSAGRPAGPAAARTSRTTDGMRLSALPAS